MKVDEITKIFVYDFADGRFSFHTAIDSNGSQTTFRSRMDVWPSLRARKKEINYKLLRNSTNFEIESWIKTHPNLPIKKKITL